MELDPQTKKDSTTLVLHPTQYLIHVNLCWDVTVEVSNEVVCT